MPQLLNHSPSPQHAAAPQRSRTGWVDYVLEPRDEQLLPRIVDINLMPGMTHTSATIQQLHRRHLLPTDSRLHDQIEQLRHYEDGTPVDRMRTQYATSLGVDRVHFIVRRNHGLESETRAAAASLTTRGTASGVVVYADQLTTMLPDTAVPVTGYMRYGA